jgi:hypothetical protein
MRRPPLPVSRQDVESAQQLSRPASAVTDFPAEPLTFFAMAIPSSSYGGVLSVPENFAAMAAHTSIGSVPPCLESGCRALLRVFKVGRAVVVILAPGNQERKTTKRVLPPWSQCEPVEAWILDLGRCIFLHAVRGLCRKFYYPSTGSEVADRIQQLLKIVEAVLLRTLLLEVILRCTFEYWWKFISGCYPEERRKIKIVDVKL